MKHIIKAGIFSFLLFGVALLIWTIRPIGRNEEAFVINPNSSLIIETPECSLPKNLLESTYILNYSKTIRYKESGEILVRIEKSNINSDDNYVTNSVDYCPISIEVNIDVKGMLIEPGIRIIEPYANIPTQNFVFDVLPLATGLKKGTIWINGITTNTQDGLIEKTPFFAIPFSIRVESFFGLPPSSIWVFAIAITLFAMSSFLLLTIINKNRK